MADQMSRIEALQAEIEALLERCGRDGWTDEDGVTYMRLLELQAEEDFRFVDADTVRRLILLEE